MATPINHTLTEDAQAFVLGTAMCALGVQFLAHGGLITGQTAGLGVLLGYTTGLSFGVLFFVINLPFYIFSWLQMGPRFTIRSFIAVALFSVIAETFSSTIRFDALPVYFAAPLAGGCVGLGLMVLFRHGASLGGIGILALYLQDRTGFRAGWTQMLFDVALFVTAFWLFHPAVVIWSLVGAFVTSAIIGVNLRRDRYIAR